MSAAERAAQIEAMHFAIMRAAARARLPVVECVALLIALDDLDRVGGAL